MPFSMFERIAEVAWDSYPRPSYIKVCRVPEALRALYYADEKDDSKDVADQLSWAVGNDHCGSYYPVLLGALPFIEDVLRNGGIRSKSIALCFLYNILGHVLDQDCGGFTNSSGNSVDIDAEFRSCMAGLRPLLLDMVQHEDKMSNLARALL